MLLRLPANAAGRDFVVGDLHGCRAMLDALLARIGFDKAVDRLFAVGDLVDRGPDSPGCLALLQEPWFFSVLGNHEQMLMMAAADDTPLAWSFWLRNGGAWGRGITREELLEHAAALSVLPLVIAVGEGDERFNVLHGEFFGSDADLDAVLAEADKSGRLPLSILWGRDLADGKVEPEKQAGLSPTFCGHTPFSTVGRIGQQIFIDTGAYLAHHRGDHAENALTIVEVKTSRLWRSQP